MKKTKKSDGSKVVKVRKEADSKATKIKSSIKAGLPERCGGGRPFQP